MPENPDFPQLYMHATGANIGGCWGSVLNWKRRNRKDQAERTPPVGVKRSAAQLAPLRGDASIVLNGYVLFHRKFPEWSPGKSGWSGPLFLSAFRAATERGDSEVGRSPRLALKAKLYFSEMFLEAPARQLRVTILFLESFRSPHPATEGDKQSDARVWLF